MQKSSAFEFETDPKLSQLDKNWLNIAKDPGKITILTHSAG